MDPVSAEIDQATLVLRAIAAEHEITLVFGRHHRSFGELLGDPPTMFAGLLVHEGKRTVTTLSPVATPNVIEPLMHEMAHAVLGYDDDDDQERAVCQLVLEWANQLPPILGEKVSEDCLGFLEDLSA